MEKFRRGLCSGVDGKLLMKKKKNVIRIHRDSLLIENILTGQSWV